MFQYLWGLKGVLGTAGIHQVGVLQIPQMAITSTLRVHLKVVLNDANIFHRAGMNHLSTDALVSQFFQK